MAHSEFTWPTALEKLKAKLDSVDKNRIDESKQRLDTESILQESERQVRLLNDVTQQLKATKSEAEEVTVQIYSLLSSVDVQLDELTSLVGLRKLLQKIGRINMSHDEIKTLIDKIKKKEKLDTNGAHSDVSYAISAIAVLRAIKMEGNDGGELVMGYSERIGLHWRDSLVDLLMPEFNRILKSLKWPQITDDNAEAVNFETLSKDDLRKFEVYFDVFLQIDRFTCHNNQDPYVRASLPINIMCREFIKRFNYHFQVSKTTRQSDKPEWYLSTILNWLRINEPLITSLVGVCMDSPTLDDAVFLAPPHVQLCSCLLEPLIDKLKKDFPVLVKNDISFAHMIDELILFLNEIRSFVGESLYAKIYPVVQISELISSEPYFAKIIDLDQRRSSELVDGIINSPQAWSLAEGSNAANDDKLKVTECGQGFILLLQTVFDRCFLFLNQQTRSCMFRMILDMEDDFRLRLSQLINFSDPTHNMRDWPFCDKYFAILNTINYVRTVFGEWIFMPEMEDISSDGTKCLQDAVSLLDHMLNELLDNLYRSFVEQFNKVASPYMRQKWILAEEDVDTAVSENACPIFAFLAVNFSLMETSLAQPTFVITVLRVVRYINQIIYEDLIMRNCFNKPGALQLKRDMCLNLMSLLRTHLKEPEKYFSEVLESCLILNMDKGVFVGLRETMIGGGGEEVLRKMAIESLTPETVLQIISKKVFH